MLEKLEDNYPIMIIGDKVNTDLMKYTLKNFSPKTFSDHKEAYDELKETIDTNPYRLVISQFNSNAIKGASLDFGLIMNGLYFNGHTGHRPKLICLMTHNPKSDNAKLTERINSSGISEIIIVPYSINAMSIYLNNMIDEDKQKEFPTKIDYKNIAKTINKTRILEYNFGELKSSYISDNNF